MSATRWGVSCAALLIAMAPAAYAQSQQGAVSGVVRSEVTGAPLAGAQVVVQGGGAVAITDEAGQFLIAGLPTGPASLRVTYIGLQAAQIDTNITAGASADLTITLSGNNGAGDRVVVRSQRLAIDDALNRYRTSDSITNFVAADDIGRFPDQNVAENLQRLPGVSITRDQGEGRFVSVRGMEAGLSTVTINGMRIGTPEDSSRAVPLDVIPSGSVDLLSITKVPTPDMPGDAVGGSIDVRSGSPFNSSRDEAFRYRVEGSYVDLSGDINGEGRLNYTDVFSIGGGRENFGVSAGINYLDRRFESDNIEAAYGFRDDLGADVLTVEEVQLRKYSVDRERFGANLNLEFRPTANDTFFANGLYSSFKDAEQRQRSIFVFEDGDLTAQNNGLSTFEDIDEDAFRRRVRFRTKEQDTWALAAGGEHRRGLWDFDYQIGYSETQERVPDEMEARFEYDLDPMGATVRVGSGLPQISLTDGGAPAARYLDNANYALDRVVLEPLYVDDNDLNLSFNLGKESAFGVNGLRLQAGVDARLKDKDTDINEMELRRTPNARASQFEDEAPKYRHGDLGMGLNAPDFIEWFNANRSDFAERPQDVDENRALNLGEDFTASEDVYATYLMGTLDRGPWRFIVGGRVEHTEYSAVGNQLNYDATGALSVTPRNVQSEYTNFLPGVHVRYDAGDAVIRAAWSNTIGRPSFGDISPRFDIDLDRQRIDMGNPELEPYKASNLDLMLDWYPLDSTLISLGVFHKDIDNYIVEMTDRNVAAFPGYDVTRPINGTDARVLGFEANAELDLKALTPSLAGFLVGANATLLDTQMEVLSRPGENFTLPQSAETSANIYAGYEAGRISARLSYSYRGKYLDELGDSREFDTYVKPSNQLDFTASYRFNDLVEVYFEASNLLDDPLELYQGSKGYTLQLEEYGPTFSIGLQGRF